MYVWMRVPLESSILLVNGVSSAAALIITGEASLKLRICHIIIAASLIIIWIICHCRMDNTCCSFHIGNREHIFITIFWGLIINQKSTSHNTINVHWSWIEFPSKKRIFCSPKVNFRSNTSNLFFFYTFYSV